MLSSISGPETKNLSSYTVIGRIIYYGIFYYYFLDGSEFREIDWIYYCYSKWYNVSNYQTFQIYTANNNKKNQK